MPRRLHAPGAAIPRPGVGRGRVCGCVGWEMGRPGLMGHGPGGRNEESLQQGRGGQEQLGWFGVWHHSFAPNPCSLVTRVTLLCLHCAPRAQDDHPADSSGVAVDAKSATAGAEGWGVTGGEEMDDASSDDGAEDHPERAPFPMRAGRRSETQSTATSTASRAPKAGQAPQKHRIRWSENPAMDEKIVAALEHATKMGMLMTYKVGGVHVRVCCGV